VSDPSTRISHNLTSRHCGACSQTMDILLPAEPQEKAADVKRLAWENYLSTFREEAQSVKCEDDLTME
jgi:hypothetical protein